MFDWISIASWNFPQVPGLLGSAPFIMIILPRTKAIDTVSIVGSHDGSIEADFVLVRVLTDQEFDQSTGAPPDTDSVGFVCGTTTIKYGQDVDCSGTEGKAVLLTKDFGFDGTLQLVNVAIYGTCTANNNDLYVDTSSFPSNFTTSATTPSYAEYPVIMDASTGANESCRLYKYEILKPVHP